MKISWVQNPRNKSLITLFVDGEEWKNVHTTIFGRNPSFPSECSNLEEWNSHFYALEYRVVKHYGLRRLAAQSLLSSSLKKSLSKRFVTEDIINKVLKELSEAGYLNDREWTKNYVRNQVERKRGPRDIVFKLSKKGIRKEDLEPLLSTYESTNQQICAIQQLLKTRYRNRDLNNFRERQKVIASLVRRGFDLNIILSSFSNINSLDISDFNHLE